MDNNSLASKQMVGPLMAFTVLHKLHWTENCENDSSMNNENKWNKKNALNFATCNIQSTSYMETQLQDTLME
jgi:hypothetical protein